MKLLQDKKILFGILLLPIWVLIYFKLEAIVDFLIYDLFRMEQGAHLTESIWFFIYEVPKVLLLLMLIIFIIGIIRTYFSPEKTRKLLEGKSLFAGNVFASLLGVVTPFCSCSAIPLFIGFVESGIPLGVTFSFLVAAPMVNEVALVLLIGLFGVETALIYVATGLLLAIFSGWLIGILKLEKYIESWVFEVQSQNASVEMQRLKFSDRITKGYESVKEIVGKIWIYILLGIAVGAGVHGYVPENFMSDIMGKEAWYSVPLSILIGIPLYSNAAGVIPIVQALLEKGASLGTALAFMMSVIGLSLPETIILKKVLKMPLIIIFISIVGIGIMLVGFTLNLIY